MKRVDIIFLSLCLAGAGIFLFRKNVKPPDVDPWSASSIPAETLNLKLTPPRSLTGKTKAEITQWREEAKALQPKLVPLVTHSPSVILSEVNEKSPWRGLVSELWNLDDNQAESTGSIAVLNPYLLCGIRYATRNTNSLEALSEVTAAPVKFRDRVRGDLMPTSMTFNGASHQLVARYGLEPGSPLLTMSKKLGKEQILIYLENCNAGDAGLGFFSIDSMGTSGTRYLETEDAVKKAQHLSFDKAMPCSQYYKLLSGKNDLYIRAASYMMLTVEELPMKIEIHFWRQQPGKASDPADFLETIVLEGAGK